MTVKADLVETRNELDAKRKKLAEVKAEAGPDLDLEKVKSLEGDTTAKAERMRDMMKEVNDLGEKLDGLVSLYKEHQRDDEGDAPKGDLGIKHRTGEEPPTQKMTKSIGGMFVDLPAYKEIQGEKGPVSGLGINLKVLMTTTAGWAPESLRSGIVVPSAQRPVQVTDLIPMGRTSYTSYKYMEETTFTNNAAETAEAGTYAESALAFTERSSPVQKLATFIPVTDEQLEDVDGIQDYLDQRLRFMVEQRLDSQILVGDGSTPNLRGILNVSGIQTQATGTDPTPDAIYKAMTKVRVTGRALPNGLVIHPTDWQSIKLLRTADGIYIWGNPSDASPDRIWGLNVAQSDAITLHTAVVGDFQNYSGLFIKKDLEVQVSNSHSTFFVEGKLAVRVDMRAALVFFRPAAFATVTGLS